MHEEHLNIPSLLSRSARIRPGSPDTDLQSNRIIRRNMAARLDFGFIDPLRQSRYRYRRNNRYFHTTNLVVDESDRLATEIPRVRYREPYI